VSRESRLLTTLHSWLLSLLMLLPWRRLTVCDACLDSLLQRLCVRRRAKSVVSAKYRRPQMIWMAYGSTIPSPDLHKIRDS
jgi:hypothetical protein